MNDQPSINDQILKQQIAANCITTGSGPFYYPPQPVMYLPKQLTVEAVENGFIISGSREGKGNFRTVAISSKGLADILSNWASQFECKMK